MEREQEHSQESQKQNGENNEDRSWLAELKEIFTDVIDLKHGLDRYGTILSIRKNVHLKGINIWLLTCAIIVACIGLDKNSPAIIIGGMLISPLMYPILGLGLSVAINDRKTLTESAANFGVAVLVALITSTIYFLVTPYGKPNVEILARTRPDILDVFVGFFGGIAGIVASSRKEGISAAIPGVAIATALLPPVCVAGYGLANWDGSIFGGAFYLFILNTFFIMIATYLVVRYLKFPFKQHTTPTQRRKARVAIFSAAALIVIPSFFFLRNSVRDIRTSRNVEAFVKEHLETNEINDFGWTLTDQDSVLLLEVDCYVENYLDSTAIDSLEVILSVNYRAKRVRLKLRQIEAKAHEIVAMQANQDKLMTEVERNREAFNILVTEKVEEIGSLEDVIDEFKQDSIMFESLKDELSILFPDLVEISVGSLWNSDFETKNEREKQFTLLLDWEKNYYASVYVKRTDQISRFVMKRFPDLDTVYVIHQ